MAFCNTPHWMLAQFIFLTNEISSTKNSTIRIPGSEVIPVPLFVPLDGTNSEDYVARVEPSASGGKKMAEYLLHIIQSGNRRVDLYVAPPTTSFVDRWLGIDWLGRYPSSDSGLGYIFDTSTFLSSKWVPFCRPLRLQVSHILFTKSNQLANTLHLFIQSRCFRRIGCPLWWRRLRLQWLSV